jgi:hypothetical protein
MTLHTPEPVISSQRYVVTEVDGRRPSDPSAFVGTVSMTVESDGTSHHICGTGGDVDGALRVYEKGADGEGKDVRVWDVTLEDDGAFSVMHGGPR